MFSSAIHKILFFLTLLIFGAAVTGWNWSTGVVCAILILAVLEIDEAYQRGKEDGRQEYLEEEERFVEQANYFNKIEKDRKKEEDEQAQKLKSIKTGQSVTISRSYGIIEPDGKDTGRRFIRKEDAENYLKKYNKLMSKENNKEVEILGHMFSEFHYPVLCRWQKNNPETLKERLQDLANKVYSGDIVSAAQALESDLEHSQ